MIVISAKAWFDSEPPSHFMAYWVRLGCAYKEQIDQFPVRFTKLEALDAKDRNYMPRIFQPKSIRQGNVGSICKELLDPKYQVTYAQIAFRSGEMLIDIRSRHQMPRTKTIKTEVLKVPPKRGIPLGNMFASLRISEESDSERSSNVTLKSWAEEVENDEKIRETLNPTPAQSAAATGARAKTSQGNKNGVQPAAGGGSEDTQKAKGGKTNTTNSNTEKAKKNANDKKTSLSPWASGNTFLIAADPVYTKLGHMASSGEYARVTKKYLTREQDEDSLKLLTS
jgi:hypothetical protein